MNNLLEQALQYADKGWSVFPCREKNSLPFWDETLKTERIMKAKSPYTAEGFEEATREEKQIKKWWERYPNAAIGVACGVSNLVVVDIDVKDERKGFENFMNLHVSDSGALHAMTPSGGMHIVYSGNVHSHSNVKAGIDLRSNGAYFIVPSSTIETQDGVVRPYKMLDDWSRTPVEVPSDLVKKLEFLRYGTTERKSSNYIRQEDKPRLINRVKEALKNLPQNYCEDYFMWVDAGLALKSLGEEGFALWNEWSMQSNKYDYNACKYRWDKFEPHTITVASIFYWAKQEAR